MGYMLTFIFIAMISLYLDFRSGPAIDKELEGKALAGQMVVWHSAASRTCQSTTTCPVGPVDAVPNLPAQYAGTSASMIGRGAFHSFDFQAADGTRKLVTFFKAPAGVTEPILVYGSMQSSLQEEIHDTDIVYAGPYLGGQVTARAVTYRIPGNPVPILYTAPTLAIPSGLSGTTMDAGAPVMATDIP